MKPVESKKPVPTIPDGVWEGSHPDEMTEAKRREHDKNITVDLMGNGYVESQISNTRQKDK